MADIHVLHSCCKRILANYLRKPKISQLHVQILVGNENVFGLYVSVNDSTIMLNVFN